MKTNEELNRNELREINGGCALRKSLPGDLIDDGPMRPKIPDYRDWILERF